MKLILFILTLLFVNLYVYSQDIDSADADYCLALRTYPELLLVKQNNDLVIRTGEEPIMCESPYDGCNKYSSIGNEKIEFIDKSGKSIVFWGGAMGFACGGSRGGRIIEKLYPLPREIQIDYLPKGLSSRTFKMSPKENEALFKDLLQFKDKIVDGYMTVSISCKPRTLKYKVTFRAKITGECDCYLIKEE
jgi:hypothetical protein